jgi:hypothetical protein
MLKRPRAHPPQVIKRGVSAPTGDTADGCWTPTDDEVMMEVRGLPNRPWIRDCLLHTCMTFDRKPSALD